LRELHENDAGHEVALRDDIDGDESGAQVEDHGGSVFSNARNTEERAKSESHHVGGFSSDGLGSVNG